MRLSPRRLTTAAAAVAALIASVVGGSTPAQANPPGPHDPFGAVTSVAAVSGGVLVKGWAADPDALKTNLKIIAIQDGRYSTASTITSVANATVATKYGTGPTPGFALTVPVATGTHTVCIDAANVMYGLSTLLRCVVTPLGTALTAAQLATHSPVGAYTSATATTTSLRVRGWATDNDFVVRPAVVVLYVDGSPASTVVTTSYPAPRPAGAGPTSLYDVTVPVATGAHVACIWVVNIGLGNNAFQGCKSVDTRGAAGTTAVTTPPLNTAVVAQAKRHIGQQYVWGAAGPTTFDCSGLVMYSYAHPIGYSPGFATPRIAADQFRAARLIPASRAVPGDLVFTYDTEGDVYHVGFFIKPGVALAAIDEAQGVNYQNIWDPAATAYGSFTHT
jgi:cell wall-associated NlpC family hydrolase